VFGTHAPARRGQQSDAAMPGRPAPLRPTRKAVVSCVCAVALGTLTACGPTGSSTGAVSNSSASAAGPATATSSAPVITIKDFGFTTPSSVGPGAKVSVNNMDTVAHTVTADSGNAFDNPAPPGNSSFTAPTKPGSYPFHCNIHPEMHGILVVK
jgi:plastocyanin